jgi:hypothetical protein
MKKIKLFETGESAWLQTIANEWLEKNQDKITVYDELTQYQVSGSYNSNWRYSLMFVYEERMTL